MAISKKTNKAATPSAGKKKVTKTPAKKKLPVKVTGKKTVSPKATPKRTATKKPSPRKLDPRQRPVVKKIQSAPLEQAVPAGHEQINMSKSEDPIRAVDQKTFDILTAKADPHKRLRLSSKPKGGIKPSGKKPLWN